MAKLPLFKNAPERPQVGRSRSKVLWHRILRSFCYLVAWIFLILVCIGSVADKAVIRQTYFLEINLANIIPLSTPNADLIDTIARTIGLHDFYQVGLWNYCEGYLGQGITHCSKPKVLYWFNPVEIILSELLSGATIALPANITSALKIARIASHWMFGLFITATVLTFILIFLSPLAVSSRPPQTISSDPAVNQAHPQHRRRTFVLLRSFPFLILTFLAALFTVVASVVATVMFIIFRNVFTSASEDLNIEAWIGTRMMVFMWIASGFNLVAFILQLGSCCASCCGGRKARKQLKRNSANGTSVSTGTSSSVSPDLREKEHQRTPPATTE